MLTKLTLRNFQGHRRFVLDVDPLVTTIVGPTDSGKSTLFRALRWLALNKQARGVEYIREGAEEVSVTLEVDGRRVTRSRGAKNSYRLSGRTYRAFGTEPPEAVSSLLAMGELNFQRQIDPPLWFTESPGEVSRRLNQVVDLSLIDSTLESIDRRLRRARAELGVVGDRLKAARGDRDGLRGFRDADEALRGVEVEEGALRKIDGEVGALSGLMIRAGEARGEVEGAEGAVKGTQEALGALEGLASSLQGTIERTNGLGALRAQGQGLLDTISGLNVEVVELKNRFEREIGETCPLCGQAVRRRG